MKPNDKKDFLQFVSSVKFPDGYASNIARCVNVDGGKFTGLKSHDCHVFMQRLLPVEEALLAGPVNYRWMYPIERLLGELKKTVRNRAKPEGSIIEAWVQYESLTFCGMYLKDVDTAFNRPQRNNDGGLRNETLSVFAQSARPFGDPVNKLKSSNSPSYSEELYNLAFGPIRAELFSGCHVNGVKFLGTARDDKLCTQNSGKFSVMVIAFDTGRCRRVWWRVGTMAVGHWVPEQSPFCHEHVGSCRIRRIVDRSPGYSEIANPRSVTTTPSSEPPARSASAATAPALMVELPGVSQTPASSASSVAQPVSARRQHRPASTTDTTSTDGTVASGQEEHPRAVSAAEDGEGHPGDQQSY
ncbi:unnamed protein product [Prunus brigantina]